MSACSEHPQWQPNGIEWRCPHCSTGASLKAKPLTPKQRARVAAAGNAVRIDDLSGSAWAKIRLRIRERDNYQCQSCGVAVLAGIVDHKVALVNGGTNDDNNLQLMCDECHRRKTASDLGRRVKTGVSVEGIPTDPNHHWFK